MVMQKGKRPRGGQEEPSRREKEGADTSGDDVYFDSYAHLGIHQEMIQDRVRTDAYLEAIQRNADFIKGKVVLDVGCGTGILSIFCARAGAKKVYAVDASDIAIEARKIVNANGLADVITVIQGKIEGVILVEKVDVIVSEWMGYCLIYESMLDSVIYARDRWLRPGGLMLPSEATLYIAPMSDPEGYRNSIDWWKDVYGIDMSSLIPTAKKGFATEPQVCEVTGENVMSWPAVLKRFDCMNVKVADVALVKGTFSLSSMMTADLHGFVLWFDVRFPVWGADGKEKDAGSSQGGSSRSHKEKGEGSDGGLCLTTAPECEQTHWQQTVLYIEDPIKLQQDQDIEGNIVLRRNKENQRFLDVDIDWRTDGVECRRHYSMA